VPTVSIHQRSWQCERAASVRRGLVQTPARRRPLALRMPSHAAKFLALCRGANTDGQCGVSSYLPVLLQPREVEGLAGLPVEALVAAKSHSAAVLAGGEALTWGSGSDGRLGHGSTGGPAAEACGKALRRAPRAANAPLLGPRQLPPLGCRWADACRSTHVMLPSPSGFPSPPSLGAAQTAATCRTMWSHWRGG
jgi:hypothetical protein